MRPPFATPAPRTGRLGVVGLLVATVTGCSPHALRESVDPDVRIPDEFATEYVPEVVAPEDWWRSFEDPGLDAAVSTAFEGNLGLRQAWARLSQAMATAEVSGSFLYPEANIDAGASRSKTVVDLNGQEFFNNRYSVGLGLSWELDLWRKIANRAEAATLRALASRDDAENTALLISGGVTDTWFAVQAQATLLALVESQIASSRTLLQLTELRYGQGVGTALQVLQQRLQLESVEAEIPDINIRLAIARNELAVLLGIPPEMLEESGIMPESALPDLPPAPELPSPRDLLERRPDLRSSFARVAAADRDVAASIAEMLPSIRLSASGGFQSNTAAGLGDELIWSIAGGLVQPFFDAGRRGAEVDRSRAVLEERLLAFDERFIIALREVEDALIRERNQIQLLESVEGQVDIARKTLKESELLFVNGQVEYLDVITAIQTLQRLERQEISVRQGLLANRATLHLAIGGEWTRDLTPPPAEDSNSGLAANATSSDSDA
ncbi:MAG: TolC family protein [Phycisphaera sp.]|nr:TolC family protein [Phycisphaera sp.]